MNDSLYQDLRRYSEHISRCFDVSCGIYAIFSLSVSICISSILLSFISMFPDSIGLSFVLFVNPVLIRVLICTDALRRNAGMANISITVRWE